MGLSRHVALHQPAKLGHQSVAPLHPLWVDRDACHGTHLNALGLLEMTDTFGAFVWVDFVDLRP